MLKALVICPALAFLLLLPCHAQETARGAPKPAEHILGTITKVDQAAHTVTVKDDKTGAESLVMVVTTRTLLKVPPGAKDLKSAQRITADDLAVGDRVDVRGSKPPDNPNAIEARSVVLMSARDLAQAHQAEADAWQHSTVGLVTAVDSAAAIVSVTVRGAEGPRPVIVNTSPATQFTRYSPGSPKTPAPSKLADIQPGDQVRVIGAKSADGATIAAQKVYSGAFRTVAGTIASISPDGAQVTIKDLQSKQPVQVMLTADSVVRKLPPEMAMMIARRFNPDYRANAAESNNGNASTNGAPPTGTLRPGGGAATSQDGHLTGAGNGNPGSRPMRAGTGDFSRIIEHAPVIQLSELKNGDAVVISGTAAGPGNAGLVASSIIAGVEPIFQAAPERQARSLGDWSLDMEAPAQ